MLAEQAYVGRRLASTLTYMLDIRTQELGEPEFGAAAYHSMLRMLELTESERRNVERQHAHAVKLMSKRKQRQAEEQTTSKWIEHGAQVRRTSPTRHGNFPGSHADEPLSSLDRSTRSQSDSGAATVPTATGGRRGGRAPASDDDEEQETSSRPAAVQVPFTPLSEDGSSWRMHTPHPAAAEHGRMHMHMRAPGWTAPDDRGALPISHRVAAAFEAFDANKSGYLDYRELRLALGHYGVDLSSEGARDIVQRYDDRPDGRLDIREFAALVADIEAGVIRAPLADPYHGARGLSLPSPSSANRSHSNHPLGAPRPWRNGSPSAGPSSHSHSHGNYGRHASRSVRFLDNGRLASGARRRGERQRRSPEAAFTLDRVHSETRLSPDAELAQRVSAAAAMAKPLRTPLVSPLIPPRQRPSTGGGGSVGGRGHGGNNGFDPLPGTFNHPRSALEEWLDTLPGLERVRPPPLLGVRPLERSEAIARTLRMECSLWEAQQMYVDSHKLVSSATMPRLPVPVPMR